jgi:hypothetical protein
VAGVSAAAVEVVAVIDKQIPKHSVGIILDELTNAKFNLNFKDVNFPSIAILKRRQI